MVVRLGLGGKITSAEGGVPAKSGANWVNE